MYICIYFSSVHTLMPSVITCTDVFFLVLTILKCHLCGVNALKITLAFTLSQFHDQQQMLSAGGNISTALKQYNSKLSSTFKKQLKGFCFVLDFVHGCYFHCQVCLTHWSQHTWDACRHSGGWRVESQHPNTRCCTSICNRKREQQGKNVWKKN